MRYRPICRNIEYARVYRRGKSYVAPQLVLYVCKNRLGRTRVGFTATKKVGHAVQRNRARQGEAAGRCGPPALRCGRVRPDFCGAGRHRPGEEHPAGKNRGAAAGPGRLPGGEAPKV